MAETIVTRIPLRAGTCTIFPTEKTTMHFVLQAVGLQQDSTITCQTPSQQLKTAILETTRLQAALMITYQSMKGWHFTLLTIGF